MICCLQDICFRSKDTNRLNVKGLKKIFQANGNQTRAGVAIQIPDKIYIKSNTVKRDKKGHFTSAEGSIHQENITILNIYAPTARVLKYMKQTDKIHDRNR